MTPEQVKIANEKEKKLFKLLALMACGGLLSPLPPRLPEENEEPKP